MTHILIADDNHINRKLLNWQLDTLGFSCHDAASGQLALDRCANEHYSVILMDLNLGDTDGYSITRTLRQRESGNRTPIIAVTAHSGSQEYERCMAAGMDDFLSKPITLSPLAKLLIRWGAHGYAPPADTPDDHGDDNQWLLGTAVAWLRTLVASAADENLARDIAEDFLERSGAHMRRLHSAVERGDEDKQFLAQFALHQHSLGIGAWRLARATRPGDGTSADEQQSTHVRLASLRDILTQTRHDVERHLG